MCRGPALSRCRPATAVVGATCQSLHPASTGVLGDAQKRRCSSGLIAAFLLRPLRGVPLTCNSCCCTRIDAAPHNVEATATRISDPRDKPFHCGIAFTSHRHGFCVIGQTRALYLTCARSAVEYHRFWREEAVVSGIKPQCSTVVRTVSTLLPQLGSAAYACSGKNRADSPRERPAPIAAEASCRRYVRLPLCGRSARQIVTQQIEILFSTQNTPVWS